ncbi:hypothetical protein GCK72_025998 [Caenorhabditis remanei]|uniref:Uncharacterized protein n=1 Tax=Caenorhabditis remanei TaxID=31234 RepID=A0A2P4VEE1_CAERE|nr:hypothetical protein GCK72_025998 [Caenorhabditis remanei]KAF1749530.1 hypothetical protein GCK72_025998 [Caenorhabditis remanei]
MSRQLSFLVFLALNLSVPVFGLTCHKVNEWEASMVHDQHFCTAYFEVSEGHASFGGSQAHPKDLPKSYAYDFLNKDDCQLQTGVDIMDGSGTTTSIWACLCFESHCNFPFSFEEFVRRGHTLRPSFVPLVMPAEESAGHQ